MRRIVWWFTLFAFLNGPTLLLHAAEPFLVFQPHGHAKGKNIVLISGDEEYRSEESMPELAKILSTYHGFHCTVLFAINPKDGTIDPNYLSNIPGLEALDSADLMVILTRFRDLPDDQMKHIVDYVESGKPIVGIRTATHAFQLKSSNNLCQVQLEQPRWRFRAHGAGRNLGQASRTPRETKHHGCAQSARAQEPYPEGNS